MTDASSIWLRDLTQSIFTNKFHNTDFIDNANDYKPYTVMIELNNGEDREVRG